MINRNNCLFTNCIESYSSGDDDDRHDSSALSLSLSVGSRALVPPRLSVGVREVRSWLMDPKTGRWRWPVNGADQVYPGIFLGDA